MKSTTYGLCLFLISIFTLSSIKNTDSEYQPIDFQSHNIENQLIEEEINIKMDTVEYLKTKLRYEISSLNK